MRLTAGIIPWAVVTAVTFTAPVGAQTSTQLWGTFTLSWLKAHGLSYELELEPKFLVAAPADEPGWSSLDITPNVEYAAKERLDLVGEVATGVTAQTDDVDSFEVSPRVGLRFHLTTRELPTGPIRREVLPRHRIVVRNLVRVEARNLFYSNDQPTDSVVRFRNRFEFQIPLNRPRVTEDGARYALADWEWFIPLGDPQERFANRQRIRAGLGYRRSRQWRFEALYIWTRSRDATDQNFTTSDNIVNLRVKRVF